jgi:hypothetical protein
MEILQRVKGVKALINITSDGLLNLARVEAKMGFEIDRLIEPHPIFTLIQKHANVDDSEMFEVFNMGIGFCYVVDPDDATLTISILESYGRKAQRIGYAVPDPKQHVRIHERKLLGYHKTFRVDDKFVRKVGWLVGDHSSIQDELSQLRVEIPTLLNLPALSPEFTSWLGKLFALVKAGFGLNSDEMRELRALSPELPSEFYDSVADRLGEMGLDEKSKNQLLTQLNKNAPEAIFKRRLHDYDDLITAMIHGLRTKCWTWFEKPGARANAGAGNGWRRLAGSRVTDGSVARPSGAIKRT